MQRYPLPFDGVTSQAVAPVSAQTYRWQQPAYDENVVLAEYIKQNYPRADCVIGTNRAARGYLILLFERNMYDFCDMNFLLHEAQEQGKSYAILLNASDGFWSKNIIHSISIVCTTTNEGIELTPEDVL